MSIKLFNGMRARIDSNPANIAAVLTKFEAALQPISEELHLKRLAELVALYHDAAALEALDPDDAYERDVAQGKGIYVSAILYLGARHKAIAATRERDPDNDFECEIGMWFDPADGDWVYLNVIHEHDEYRRALLGLPEVEEFAYWNNTDRADGIDQDAWHQRCETWQRVTGVHGLTWSLLGQLGPPGAWLDRGARERVLDLLPTRAARARAIARRLVRFDPEPASTSEAIERIEELIAATDELAAQLEPKLDHITIASL